MADLNDGRARGPAAAARRLLSLDLHPCLSVEMATSDLSLGAGKRPTIVIVQRGLSQEWKVTPVGRSRPQSFSALGPAISYAQLWGAIHRPSIIRVLADGGRIEDEWSFN